MSEATPSLFHHFRLRPTNRARVLLAMLPLVLPLNVILWLCIALVRAVLTFASELSDQASYTVGHWYRHVYRPARYGSVWDDVDENGRPKAWGEVRGSGPA